MMPSMRLFPALAMVLTLGACGSDPEPPKIETVADLIGCTDFKQDTSGQMLTREIGACKIDGQKVWVHTFTSSEDQERWLDFSGSGVLVEGDLWVVQTFDADTAEAVAVAGAGTVLK